ncbi:unnamed protein product [Rhizoctonia solani]|uniref:Uncharacterized protein n=1 Tax=Rhizoctonia solani TaxID=456999 RepID=A0A8H3C8W3_9AGAM|nr:unnamed protein product [Rhizoctonia solani]
MISGCLPLQYRILLDRLGFVATPNTGSPSLELKVRILQEKKLRLNHGRLAPSATIQLENHNTLANIQLSRGVLVVDNIPLTSPLETKIHRLASFNKGTDYEYSLAHDENMPVGYVGRVKVEAALDLLVLVEYLNGDDLRFSLRSLKTGLPHPDAAQSTIVNHVLDIHLPRTHTFGVEIVDRRIVHVGQSLSRSTPLLTAWDWTTGELVTSTPIPGHNYAFLSKDIFVVACDQTKCGGAYILLALSVFTLEDISPGEAARFVAILCLPTTDGPSRPVFELYPTPPIFISNPHESYTSVRIFDLDEGSRYLALRLTARPTRVTSNESTGILFIHSLGLRTLAKRLAAARRSPVFVRWDNWGFMTCWLQVKPPVLWRSIYGHRAAFLRLDSSTGDCEVLVYDLRVTRHVRSRPVAGDPSISVTSTLDEQMNRLFSVKGKSTRHPALVSSFWVGPDVVPKGRAGEYYFDLKMDDEHVVLIKRGRDTSASNSTMHVFEI